MLYEFDYSDKTFEEDGLEKFFAMMRKKYPEIIGRKRFCVHESEKTEELIKDIAVFGVELVEERARTQSSQNNDDL
jgi:hypothetical protein